jgi:hypothetical protein
LIAEKVLTDGPADDFRARRLFLGAEVAQGGQLFLRQFDNRSHDGIISRYHLHCKELLGSGLLLQTSCQPVETLSIQVQSFGATGQ